MPPTQVRFAGTAGALGTCGDVFITVIREPLTLGFLRELRRESQLHRERFGTANRGFTVLETTSLSANPPGAVRDEASKLAADYPAVATALVLEGSGFAAAGMRLVISGMHLLHYSSGGRQYKITATTQEAARWMLRIPAPGHAALGERELLDAVERVRRAVAPSGSVTAEHTSS